MWVGVGWLSNFYDCFLVAKWNLTFIGFPVMWRCFLWRWRSAYLVVVKRQISILFFSHVLVCMVTPLFYYCYCNIFITIFVITIFITVLQNYFNMNINFLSGTRNTAKLLTIFAKKLNRRCLMGIGYTVLCIFPLRFGQNFRTPLPKKNLVTCIRVATLLEKFFLRIFRRFKGLFWWKFRRFHQITR